MLETIYKISISKFFPLDSLNPLPIRQTRIPSHVSRQDSHLSQLAKEGI